MKPIEAVTYEGQPFVDERIYLNPKPAAVAVGLAFRGRIPGKLPTDRFERVKLRWVKPVFGGQHA